MKYNDQIIESLSKVKGQHVGHDTTIQLAVKQLQALDQQINWYQNRVSEDQQTLRKIRDLICD